MTARQPPSSFEIGLRDLRSRCAGAVVTLAQPDDGLFALDLKLGAIASCGSTRPCELSGEPHRAFLRRGAGDRSSADADRCG